jgi:putative restriction endonuclease
MDVAVTTAGEGFPRRASTVEDISRMIDAGVIREDERFELVEGDIVMMPVEGIARERIKSALTVAISRALPDHLTIAVEATLRLSDTLMLAPDVAVFPNTPGRDVPLDLDARAGSLSPRLLEPRPCLPPRVGRSFSSVTAIGTSRRPARTN